MKNRYMSFEKFNKLIDFLKDTYGLTEEEGVAVASDVLDILYNKIKLGNKESEETQHMAIKVLGCTISEKF